MINIPAKLFRSLSAYGKRYMYGEIAHIHIRTSKTITTHSIGKWFIADKSTHTSMISTSLVTRATLSSKFSMKTISMASQLAT